MDVRCSSCQAMFPLRSNREATCPKCGRTMQLPGSSLTASQAARPSPARAARAAVSPGPVAYDPGYANLGHAPIFVQAKPSWARPGIVTAAAVCGIVAAAMDIFGAFIWFAFRPASGFFHESPEQWTMYGWLDFLFAIGLIAGAAGVFGRQLWGRYLLATFAVGDLVFSMWLASQDHFTAFFPVPLYLIAAIAVMLPEATRYFRTRDPTVSY